MIKKVWGILFLLAASLGAKEVQMDVELSHPVMESDKKQHAYLRVKLTGFEMPSSFQRTPLNVALVLDRSGSMSGEKIEKTKEAAIAFVNRLKDDDIVSIITYDDRINVLLAATKLHNRQSVIQKIRQIRPGGSTALYAGVTAGAQELRKFADKKRVSRIILLSDGIANKGPSTPSALADLGAKLIREGFSVTTLGLGDGYNEDLMTQLAAKSDGNHKFLRTTEDIRKFFNKELGVIGAIVARDVTIEIECAEGVKPVRVLDLDAKIDGNRVQSGFNQIYSKHERYMLLELEIAPHGNNVSKKVANVTVTYSNMQTHTAAKLTATPTAHFKHSSEENPGVMIAVTEQLATIANAKALKLRDQGRIKEAKKLLKNNSMMLEEKAKAYNAPQLKEQAQENADDMDHMDEASWKKQRKMMRDKQTKRFYKGAL